ncbi:MAG: hypothetical protein LBF00_01315, partial [Mycoplasmataceae bacterium]|nr:hypothetical protein [Mycoplasmataceae bacterium]
MRGGVSLDIKIDKVEVSGNKVSVSPDGTNIVFQSDAGDDDKVLYTFNKEVYGQYTETSIKLFFLALVTSSTLES